MALIAREVFNLKESIILNYTWLSWQIFSKFIGKKDPSLFSLKVRVKLMISFKADNLLHIKILLAGLLMKTVPKKETLESKLLLFKVKSP